MDPRLADLLAIKEVNCTLRKQPPHLTQWFMVQMAVYNALYARPDRDVDPIKTLLDRLFTLLKFVSKPNNPWRKDAIIEQYYPSLQEDIKTALQ